MTSWYIHRCMWDTRARVTDRFRLCTRSSAFLRADQKCAERVTLHFVAAAAEQPIEGSNIPQIRVASATYAFP